MKHRVPFTVAALAFVLLFGGAPLYAQSSYFDIPFQFMVGGKAMSSGQYTIDQANEDQPLMLRGPGGAEVVLPFITRLSEPATPLAEPRLAFDKVGDTYYLSEVWLLDKDGYLVRATKESHTHHTVKGKKAK